MIFLTFLLPSIFVMLFAWFFTKTIVWKEVIVQLLSQMALIGIMTAIMLSSNTRDVEVWNGQVTKKYSEKVSCDHSYRCNCYQSCSGSGKSRSCTTVCQTCYEHSYDVSWRVKSNIGIFTISRVDRRGLKTPPRWETVKIGEPVSSTHSYTNYIKGSPDSLFHKKSLLKKYKENLPKYPSNVYDYYRLNRLVNLGVNVDTKLFNEELSKINGELGPLKEVNFILVLVPEGYPYEYHSALEQHWLGGKKNDAILVISADKENNIEWVDVISFSYSDFKVALRNDIIDAKKVTPEILPVIKNRIEKTFKRRPMQDYEYLQASVQPTHGQWIFGFIFSIILALGLSYFFHKNDNLH